MPTITTFTGKEVDPLELRDCDVDILDIAHALALLCRFNGHCREFYSVAQHSVWVSEHCPPEHALAGLLHDAAEAYLGDVPTPLKRRLPEFEDAEQRAQSVIARVFGLPCPEPRDVRAADTAAFEFEKERLLCCPGVAPQEDSSFTCSPWREAETEFLRRFEKLRRA